MYRRQISLIAVLALAYLLLGCGAVSQEKEKSDATSPKGKQDEVASKNKDPWRVIKPGAFEAHPETPPKLGEPAHKLTSVAFSKAFKDDRDAAEMRYAKSTVELTGTVVGIGRIAAGDCLALEGVEAAPTIGWRTYNGVQCFTAEPLPWKKAMPGQVVKLRGLAPEFLAGAALRYCQIVEVSGKGPERLTAQELAESFRRNPTKFAEDHKDNYGIVTGKIARWDLANNRGPARVHLATSGAMSLECALYPGAHKVPRKISIGDTVTLIGEYWFDGETVELTSCHVIP